MLTHSHIQPTLHYIIDQAYKSYKKQQHQSNNSLSSIKSSSSNFNILRVLTQFKQIFPSTPEHLYKQLMMITKKYNPQSITEWKRAVNNSININNMNKNNSLNLYNNNSQIRSLSSSIISHKQHYINNNNNKNNQNSLNKQNHHHRHHQQQEYSIKTYKQQLDDQINNLQSKRMKLLKISSNILKNHQNINNSTLINKYEQNKNIITEPVCNQFDASGVNWQGHQYEQDKQNNMMYSNRSSINIKNVNNMNNNMINNPTQFHHISFQPQYSHEKNKVIIQSRRKYDDQTINNEHMNIIVNKNTNKSNKNNNNSNQITTTPTTASLRSKLAPCRAKSTIILPSKSKYSQILSCLPHNNNEKKINPYIQISKLDNINMSNIQMQQNYYHLPTSKDYDKYDKKTLYSQNINTSYTNSRMVQNKDGNNNNHRNINNSQSNSNIKIKTTRDQFHNHNNNINNNNDSNNNNHNNDSNNNNHYNNNTKKLRNNSQNTLSTCHNINYQQTRQSFNYKPNSTNNINHTYKNLHNNTNRIKNSLHLSSSSQQQQQRQFLSHQQQYSYYKQQKHRIKIMNQRAVTFYQFNTKLKTFSKLLANYQVTEQYKRNKQKAKIFYQSYLLSKCIIGLKGNIFLVHKKEEKYNKVRMFYQRNLKAKVWNVFKVLKDLKIQENQDDMVKRLKIIKQINIIELIISSLQGLCFKKSILKILIIIKCIINQNQIIQLISHHHTPPVNQHKTGKQNNTQTTAQILTQKITILHYCIKNRTAPLILTLLTTYKKAQHFSQTHNIENLFSIYKYFGLNILITKQSLEQFIITYKKSIKQLIFNLLLKNKQQKTFQPKQFYEQKLLNKSFRILLYKYKQNKQQKEKQIKVIKYREKHLCEKIFKVMVKEYCENKVYKKREKYLENQRNRKIKRFMFKKLVKSYKNNVNKRKENNEMIKKAGDILLRFIVKKSFELLQINSQHYLQRQLQSQKYYQQKLLKSKFTHLSTLLISKKKYINLCHSNKLEFRKSLFKKWHSYSIKKHHISSLSLILKKHLFRTIFSPLNKSIIKSYYVNLQDQRNFNKQIFDKWKDIIKRQKQQRQIHRNNFQKIFKFNMAKDLMNEMKRNMKKEKQDRRRQEIEKKIKIVQQNNRNNIKGEFIKRLIEDKKDKILIKLKLQSLTITIKHINLQTFITNSSKNQQFTHKASILHQYLNNQYSLNFFSHLNSNFIQSKSSLIIFKQNKKLLSTFLLSINVKYKKIKQNQEKSTQFYTKNIQEKVMVSFVKEYIDINDKTLEIKKYLKKERLRNTMNMFVNNTQIQKNLRIKSQTIQKHQFLTQLSHNKCHTHHIQQLSSHLLTSISTQFLHLLHINKQHNLTTKSIQSKSDQLKKSIFISRLQHKFINKLFYKKHLFMSYKFRALKLQQNVFEQWKNIGKS